MKKVIWCAYYLVCSIVPATLVLGQTTAAGTANVTGRVSDQTGAAVPDAAVTLVDRATNAPVTHQTNSDGIYLFNDVAPGSYDLMVSKQGFRKAAVSGQQVVTGTNLTLNVSLEIGTATETVEVKDVLGADLQTENATMGTTLGGNAILNLPTISRDVSNLVFFQPTSAPTFNGAEGNTTSGQIAGNFSDQNTFTLDGGNNTSDLDGDNATYVGHNGMGVMPMPAESVEEFHVNTNNTGADFSSSGGGQIMVVTKRGTSTFHGAAYDFFQSDALNSNDWYNNFLGDAKPKAHFNRFGGALGGPLAPSFWGGKTYFYVNYEGQRYPQSGPITSIVPSNLLRQGIIQEPDANGNLVQYNLATAAVCGTGGNAMCDPRGIGLDPQVRTLWNKYEPACNNFSAGDPPNLCGYTANVSIPLANDFGVVRLDHDFGSNWRFFSSYRYYRQIQPNLDQVDIGGLLPGDTLGQPVSASTNIVQPRFLVAGITGTLSPTLTNDFHFSFTRNNWTWIRAGATPQLPGLDGALEIGGDNDQALIPMIVDTQNARPRLYDGRDFDYRDNVSWLKGTHLVQLGGEWLNEYWHFDRYDNVVGGLTQLVNEVGQALGPSGPFDFSAYEPKACTATVTANCLPSNYLNDYNALASDVMGLAANSSVVVTRQGSNLQANPLGTPVRAYEHDQTWNLFFNDTWKIKPNFTLTYGLNYQAQLPPIEAHGEQDIMVNAATNTPLLPSTYLSTRATDAANGTIYEPTIGFSPIGDVAGLHYPYKPFWGEVAPRVAIAWTPDVNSGWLGKLFGDKATVIRAGYGRFYTRNLGIDLISDTVLGDGFLSPVACQNPTINGTCTQSGGTTPATAFRVGVDGTNPPVGTIAPTLSSPVTPGFNGDPTVPLFATLANNYRPGSSDQIDFSIQRQFKGNWVLELGYVGTYARNLYQGEELSDVPYMLKMGGQTFAQAYDNLYNEVAHNQAITPQPFFQAALPANSAYCSGYANCTAAVATKEAGNITTQSVGSLWGDLDSTFPFGPSTLLDAGQCGLFCYATTSLGYSNYNAGVASLQKRGQNANIIANFTWSHALGIGGGLNQALTLASLNDPYNPGVDYGAENYDRKFTANLLGSWNLPFGKGQRWSSDHGWINRVIGGWVISPIFSYGSGTPLPVYDGSEQEFGAGVNGDVEGDGCQAVPLSSMSYSSSMGYNAVNNGLVGSAGNAANGGPGLNLYGSNAAAVFNNFRPPLVGIDGRCGGAGILRGQQRWNLDLGLTKDLAVTERAGIQFYAQAFNLFNHTEFNDPANVLQAPQFFGVPSGPGNPYNNTPNYQYNALALGAGGGSNGTQQYTRIIQLGVRIRF